MSITGGTFDFSGLGVVLEGSAARREIAGLSGEWSAYVASPRESPFLRLRVARDRRVEGPGGTAPKGMSLSLHEGAAIYRTDLGTCRVERDGEAEVVLAPGEEDARRRALQNFVRAALAFLLPTRNGAAVHSAGIVVEGRGFLVVGASGAGKSTAAALAESEGALVVSDDLVLVDGASGEAELLGSPFRSTHLTVCPPGRWPLAAILFPTKGPAARLDPVQRLAATARLLANFTFVADAIGEDPRVGAVVERLVDRVPCAMLTFARDPSFVDLLRRFGG